MSPIVKEMLDRGLLPVIQTLLTRLPSARLALKTNDVVLIAIVDSTGDARLYHNTRQHALASFLSGWPEAKITIDSLQKALPPNEVRMIIFLGDEGGMGTSYTVAYPVPDGETRGVLN